MNKSRLLIVAGVLSLAGCASPFMELQVQEPVPSVLPSVAVPEGVEAMKLEQSSEGNWWQRFDNQQLTSLIEKALADSTEVRTAVQRVYQAGAELGVSRGAKWPGLYAEFGSSRNRPTGTGNVPVMGGTNVYSNQSLIVGMSWELDLWGRLRDLDAAAAAKFMAQDYTLAGVRLSVSTMVASLYFKAQVNDLLVATIEQTIQSRQDALGLAKKRFAAGVIGESELRQVESEYLTVKAQLPDAQEARARNLTALAVLVGGTLPTIEPLSVNSVGLSSFMVIPPEQPSHLLLRRPDLRASEQELKAADANLSAARKAFFPSVKLTGSSGRESAELANLFSGPSRIWSFAADLTQPIFQAGQLQNRRDAELAKRNQAVIAYEAAIRKAFGEVNDSLVAQEQARLRLQSRFEQIESLKRLTELAQKRLDAGVVGQLELLDAQRNLLSARLEWAKAWGSQQAALLEMVTALGGGFEAREGVTAE